MVSINSNASAYTAQSNISRAANNAASSVSRLSSGNRIVKSSDDVAALSVGTSLKTGVTTLRQALSNATQGSSLLQVADGALSQISDILQRQKAIATQANSGTLSDTERGYLNQEFQSLSKQIDQIAGSTQFSSVNLLDGSLSGAAAVGISEEARSLAVLTAPQTIFTFADELASGDTIVVNGVTLTAGTEFTVGTDGTDQASDLITYLNGSTAQADTRLSKFYFSNVAGAVQVTVKPGQELLNRAEASFTYANGTVTVGGDITGAVATTTFNTGDSGTLITFANAVPVNGDKISIGGVEIEFTTSTQGTAAAVGKVQVGATLAATAENLANFLNQNTDARLSNFYFETSSASVTARLATGALAGTTGNSIVTSTVSVGTAANFTGTGTITVADTYSKDGLGEDRTRALGAITGSLLATGGSGAQTYGDGINLSAIRNNADFIGKIGEGAIGQFDVAYTATDTVVISLKVGDVTYTSAATDISSTSLQSITLNGVNSEGAKAGGSFSIAIKGAAVTADSITNQDAADDIATQLNQSFVGVTFAQTRDLASFNSSSTVMVSGVEIARMDGVSLDLRSDDFSNVEIQDFQITAPIAGRTDATFAAVINGETYTSLSGIGKTFDNNKAIQLQSTTNPSRVLTIFTSNNDIATSTSISMDVSTQENADAVAAAFRTALGLDDAGESLNFQIGAASSDTIGVKISNVASAKLYGGETLDVTTLEGAQAASDVLDSAIAMVSEIRANVGALQSRLNFTSANLQSSIENQDAARGVLLDTDVAAESTAYSTAQVQLQAGIAVLAQANQLPQNLLKLIQ